MRESSRGRAGFTSETGRGVSLMMDESNETLVSPANGRSPVASS
jgi:hypothetical protein